MPTRLTGLLLVAGWLVILTLGVLVRLFTSSLAGDPASLWGTLRRQIHFVGPWILLTPAVGWLARRHDLAGGRWRTSLLVHVLGLGAVVFLHAIVNGVTYPLFYPGSPAPDLGRRVFVQLASAAPISLLFYATVVAATHGLEFLIRAKQREVLAPQLEARLAEAQMAMLRTRLQPEVLTAAVEASADLVSRDLKRARRLLVRLGDLLRANLETTRRSYVELEEELRLVRLYLDLRSEIGSGRTTLAVDVPGTLMSARVPGFVLRSLVERLLPGHGESDAVSEVVVRGRRNGQDLQLEIGVTGRGGSGARAADRPPRTETWEMTAGRKSLYPGSVKIWTESADGGRWRFVLRMPLELPSERIAE